ncbi:MAG: sensor histidine kinase [Filimonas sp.]|nr:sensor histidine kinase [Filimonas sp.]
MHQKEMTDLKVQYDQTILQSQLEIQEQTFRNISQEIHDNIGQALSLAKLNLNTISGANLEEKIGVTENLLTKAIADLRDLSKSLHGEKITDIGLIAAIEHELNIVEKSVGIKTTFACEQDALDLSGEQVIVVFRMFQEILNNTLKHAKASAINVTIDSEDNGKTNIKVADNGVGFDILALDDKKTGIGLKNMRQRAKLIKGDVQIRSTAGKGTTVTISVQSTSNIFTL